MRVNTAAQPLLPTAGARWLNTLLAVDAATCLASGLVLPKERLVRFVVGPDDALVPDPYKALQPPADAEALIPEVVFCPLLAFTEAGGRIGYGAGHYDKWLAAHPPKLAIGLAWDCQLVDELPIEPHDMPLDYVITPTRLFGRFK